MEEEDGDSSGGEFLSDMVSHFKTYGSRRMSKRLSLRKHENSPRTKMKRRKTKVQNELLESERSYVSDLQQLLDYINSLQDFRQSWNKIGRTKNEISAHVREIARLRPAVESLFGLHKSLLSSLEKNETAIARIILQFASYMKMYATYLDPLDRALDAVSQLENQHGSFFYCVRVGDQDLDSLLIKPAQRVTRYTLLLKELLKNTPESDKAARVELSNAIESVSSSASHCEGLLKKRKEWLKFHKTTVKRGWGTNLEEVASGRPILHAGEVMKLNRRGKFHVKTFVLFKNSLCYGRRVPPIIGKLKLQKTLSLESMQIAEVKDEKMLKCLHELSQEFRENSFQIECVEKSFVVSCFSRREKLFWVQTLKEAAERRKGNNPSVPKHTRRRTAPVWEVDTKTCSVCDVRFGWRLWRHHCRSCGRSSCGHAVCEPKPGCGGFQSWYW